MTKNLFWLATLIFFFTSCMTATKPPAEPAKAKVHIDCINSEFSEKSNLDKFEKKFVLVPYKSLKTPGKKDEEKDIDDTDNLYFARVSKMFAKILTDAGLQQVKAPDKNTLVIGFSWNMKYKRLGYKETANYTSSAYGQVKVAQVQDGEVYLSRFYMKAVGSDKKTTRWEASFESVNSDTFYLNVIPTLLVGGKDYLGKTCNAATEVTVAKDSPEVVALKGAE